MIATPFEVRHASGAPAYALREQDRSTAAVVTYSGDTEWADALLPAAEGADLFLCEGYTPGPVRWHLDLDTLAQHARHIDCRELVLTHMSPSVLDLEELDWARAYDGLALDLKP